MSIDHKIEHTVEDLRVRVYNSNLANEYSFAEHGVQVLPKLLNEDDCDTIVSSYSGIENICGHEWKNLDEEVKRVISKGLNKKAQKVVGRKIKPSITTYVPSRDYVHVHNDRGVRDGAFAFVALEDVNLDSARFYAYPNTHESKRCSKVFSSKSPSSLENKKAALANYQGVSPLLKKEDVVVFDTGIVHGAIPAKEGFEERKSLIVEYDYGFSWRNFRKSISELTGF